MSSVPLTVTLNENITLITIDNNICDTRFVAFILGQIAKSGINVDMINISPYQGKKSGFSFSISDDDFGKAIDIIALTRETYPDIKPIISSGNTKILISSPEMRDAAGVAADVFGAVAAAEIEIRLVTTSEIDISLLVEKAFAENAVAALEAII